MCVTHACDDTYKDYLCSKMSEVNIMCAVIFNDIRDRIVHKVNNLRDNDELLIFSGISRHIGSATKFHLTNYFTTSIYLK